MLQSMGEEVNVASIIIKISLNYGASLPSVLMPFVVGPKVAAPWSQPEHVTTRDRGEEKKLPILIF